MARTMLSTTLAFDISSSAQAIQLASVASITAGRTPGTSQTILYVDREAILVLDDPIQLTVPRVMRGVQGTAAAAHTAGATVYYGPPNAFSVVDPSGRIPSTPDIYLPRVVIPTGGIWNDDGAGNWEETSASGGGGLSGPSGSATLNFGAIGDGDTADLTFTVTGAVVNDKVAPSWPSTLNAGLVASMFVSATNTVTVRLANLSGAPIDPASATYGAQIVRS